MAGVVWVTLLARWGVLFSFSPLFFVFFSVCLWWGGFEGVSVCGGG